MNRRIRSLSGCVLLWFSALAGAMPAAPASVDCALPCVFAPCRTADDAGCGIDGDARPLRSRARFGPRRPAATCPPWHRCAVPAAPGDVFRRFDDTARERLRPLPAPPIRG
jgi:hypothetical protein